MELTDIVELVEGARVLWWIVSGIIILGLVIWRVRTRDRDDFEKRKS